MKDSKTLINNEVKLSLCKNTKFSEQDNNVNIPSSWCVFDDGPVETKFNTTCLACIESHAVYCINRTMSQSDTSGNVWVGIGKARLSANEHVC